jgi:hypothetical protein
MEIVLRQQIMTSDNFKLVLVLGGESASFTNLKPLAESDATATWSFSLQGGAGLGA